MDSRPASPGPAYRRLSVEERREQLIETAHRLFASRPPEEVSLDDVARATGVSRPLVYRYFPGGKQQLYEAALGSSARDLEACFEVPAHGPLTDRLAAVLDRYLAFVDSHAEGFTALLKGGNVVQTARTTAIVDGVRRAAARQVLLHLRVSAPGPLLHMTVRTWISTVEAASLIWLDEQRPHTAAELRDWLVDHFVALLAVTAGKDPRTAEALRAAADLEHTGGRVDRLMASVLSVVSPAVAD
ncbi:TetR/AcrR family transcriptional regulator [Streptomyces sp. RFCAC02]|uniref:TetR/AcrR family transcriptional regulator n=1 Tax=Streptomyces sp. RFCAC02 TaxID=2499143 RepID=UPI00101E8A5A|nr:TetR/AcrR family transcriptional regulator [Streptomyces sp. RFCAC02]